MKDSLDIQAGQMEGLLTASEKRAIQKIHKIKAKIRKIQTKLNAAARKERNGQRIAFGVFGEKIYRNASRDERVQMATEAGKLLSGRNLDRVLQMFKRLEKEKTSCAAKTGRQGGQGYDLLANH